MSFSSARIAPGVPSDIMTQPEIRIYPDATSLFRAAANFIAASLQTQLHKREKASFVLAGGKTPAGVYDILADSYTDIDWTRVEFFWGDERCVPPDSEQSNYHLAYQYLLSRIPVPDVNLHRIAAEIPDREGAALRYQDEIQRALPGPAPPSFDLVLLGMGEDGHTASIFPDTEWSESRLVIPSLASVPPIERISMTPRLLNSARQVIFLVSGAAKAPALRGVLQNPSCAYPAKRIQPISGTLVWMVDSAAASLLNTQTK